MFHRRNKRKQKRQKKYVKLDGSVYVTCTSNNTKLTLTDIEGAPLSWSSGGLVGFKGSKRSTSYAAQLAAEVLGKKAFDSGIKNVTLFFKGMGKGRFSVPKGLKSSGLKIQKIVDKTPMPHNGCRPPKKRRI